MACINVEQMYNLLGGCNKLYLSNHIQNQTSLLLDYEVYTKTTFNIHLGSCILLL
jgi:hypothetical protein